MGSEILVIAYSVLAFLCLCLYFVLDWQGKTGATGRSQERGGEAEGFLPRGRSIVDSEFNPIVFGFKLLAVAFFFISLIGLGDAVMESYDYCDVVLNSSFEHYQYINETAGTPNADPINILHNVTTTNTYVNFCSTNTKTEGLSFYKLVFLLAELAGFLFLLAMLLQLYFFIRDKIWARIRGFFRRRT